MSSLRTILRKQFINDKFDANVLNNTWVIEILDGDDVSDILTQSRVLTPNEIYKLVKLQPTKNTNEEHAIKFKILEYYIDNIYVKYSDKLEILKLLIKDNNEKNKRYLNNIFIFYYDIIKLDDCFQFKEYIPFVYYQTYIDFIPNDIINKFHNENILFIVDVCAIVESSPLITTDKIRQLLQYDGFSGDDKHRILNAVIDNKHIDKDEEHIADWCDLIADCKIIYNE